MTEWHYTKMGLQQGPVPEDELRTKIHRAEIGPTTLVWKEGMAEWLPLSQVPELQPQGPTVALEPLSIPTVSPPPEQEMAAVANPSPSGNIPLPQPPAYHENYAAPYIPSYMVPSIISLVLWALSILIICIPFGLPFAIVGLVFGTKVDSLKAQGNLVEAQAASKTAKVWMIISYALFGLPVLGVMAMAILVALK